MLRPQRHRLFQIVAPLPVSKAGKAENKVDGDIAEACLTQTGECLPRSGSRVAAVHPFQMIVAERLDTHTESCKAVRKPDI